MLVFSQYQCIQNLSLQWRHKERDDISNHRCLDCLFHCLFKRRSKKTSNLPITGIFYLEPITWKMFSFDDAIHGGQPEDATIVAFSFKMASIRRALFPGASSEGFRQCSNANQCQIYRGAYLIHWHLASGRKYVLNGQKTAWLELVSRAQLHVFFVDATNECKQMSWTQLQTVVYRRIESPIR